MRSVVKGAMFQEVTKNSRVKSKTIPKAVKFCRGPLKNTLPNAGLMKSPKRSSIAVFDWEGRPRV